MGEIGDCSWASASVVGGGNHLIPSTSQILQEIQYYLAKNSVPSKYLSLSSIALISTTFIHLSMPFILELTRAAGATIHKMLN